MIETRETTRFFPGPDSGITGRAGGLLTHAQAGSFGAGMLGQASESLLTIGWRNRWVILVCTGLSIVAGLIYVQTAVPVYESTSRLYLDYVNIMPEVGEPGRLPQTEKYLQTQASLLQSRPIVAVAVQALEAQHLKTLKNVDVPVAFVHKNLSVEVGRKDEIISVSFRSPYPVEAAQIVNQAVEAYMASRTEHEQQNAAQVLKILQDEMARARQELAQKRTEFEEFQIQQMPLAMGSDQGSGVTSRYLELQAALTQAQIAALEAESFCRGVNALVEDTSALRQYIQAKENVRGFVGAATEKTPLETRLAELDLEKEKLSVKLTADHPVLAVAALEVSTIQERLAELDDRFRKATLAAAEQQDVEAKQHERQLAQMCEEQRKQVVMFHREVAQYQRLRSEVDQLTQYTQTLEQQVREIRKIVGEDIGQLRMAILEPALAAPAPSSPHKSKVMALALVVGILLGGGIAVMRDWLDQTLRSTDEISGMLGTPVLGVVPAMSRRQDVRLRGQRVFLQPDSHEAEAFRTVRTALFFGAPKEKAKTLLVTSPASGDGKSTLVSNLGIAMASAGQRTIIVDADLRKPTQHVIFGVDNHEKCLRRVFTRKIKLREAIQPTRAKGLSLLTCGEGFSNPAETLHSPQFAVLLRRLAEVYDRILVDAPPVMAVTDAQIIGALCDCTVLVLRADTSTRKLAQRAIDALQSVGARVLGVVVNDVHKSDSRYGYYGCYQGSYGDGSNGGKGKSTERTETQAHRRRPARELTSAPSE